MSGLHNVISFLFFLPLGLLLAAGLLEGFVLRRRDREAEPGVLWLLFCAVIAAMLAAMAGAGIFFWKGDGAWLTPSFWMFGMAGAGSLAWLLKRLGRNRNLLILRERFQGADPAVPPKSRPGQAFWILSYRAALVLTMLAGAGALGFQKNPAGPRSGAGFVENGVTPQVLKSAAEIVASDKPEAETAAALVDPTKAETPSAELSAVAAMAVNTAASESPPKPETQPAAAPEDSGADKTPNAAMKAEPAVEETAPVPVIAPPAARPVSRNSVYFSKVRPILAKHCVSCHGEAKQKGDFAMHEPDAIRAGINGKPAIIPGNAAKSRIFIVTGLPPDDTDKMPPKGAPLNSTERKILADWINNGADLGDGVSIPGGQGGTFAVDTIAQSLDEPDKALVEQLKKENVIVRGLSKNGRVLELDFSHSDRAAGDLKLEQLAPLALNIYALDLGRTKVTDADLAKLAPLRNLARLLLNRTQITDSGLANLKANAALEHLNLYGTKVTDAGLENLAQMKSLKKVFLWQSMATPDGVKKLAKASPDLVVSMGQ